MRRLLVLMLAFGVQANAEVIEEIVVTGSYVEHSPPAQRVVRSADNLLLKVLITNDARDEDERKSEIHATLLGAVRLAKKTKNIELSSVSSNDFVLPLNSANYKIDLMNGSRPDTSQAFFRVKTRIVPGANAEQLLSDLKRFTSDLKMTGRTLVEVQGNIEVSIINPRQYRAQAIKLMAEDVKTVTGALGSDYRVVLTGIDKPVEWARVGSTDVAIFIPYEYIVVPTSVSSITSFPDY